MEEASAPTVIDWKAGDWLIIGPRLSRRWKTDRERAATKPRHSLSSDHQ
jgi:hypothetical protein